MDAERWVGNRSTTCGKLLRRCCSAHFEGDAYVKFPFNVGKTDLNVLDSEASRRPGPVHRTPSTSAG